MVPARTVVSRVGALVVAATILAAGCTSATPRPTGPAAAVGPVQVGVNVHSLYESRNCDGRGCRAGGLPVRAGELDAVRDAGVGWIRADVGWVNSEPDQPGKLDKAYAARTASLVDDAHARGLRVLAVVWASPGWASGAPARPTEENRLSRLPPTDAHLADYARFLAGFVKRTKVDAVEVWNEPNLRTFWNEADPAAPDRTSVGRYAKLLQLAGEAVHGLNGRPVPVLGGAVARADDRWLSAMYEQGAVLAGGAARFRASFDGLAIHPYPDPSDGPPGSPDTEGRQNLIHIDAVHDLLARVGDGAKPVWVTEFGWSSNQRCAGRDESPGVSEADQARYLGDAFQLFAARPWVKAAFWYDVRDDGDDPCAREDNFGLLRRAEPLSPKPAYRALEDLIAAARRG
ncbi:MAG TPA: cellulase family glycosylhydrolase [Acidimicrobiales bacterium]|nr:cellulase family glycosylhydrolase [Acidimicrobiales bacterium]